MISPTSPLSSVSQNVTSPIYSHFVCRVGGLPVRYLEDLRSQVLKEIGKNLHGFEEQLNILKSEIEQIFYEVIGTIQERDKKHLLLELKRDIHNLRLTRGDILSSVLELLPNDTSKQVSMLLMDIERYELFVRRAEQICDLEAKRIRHTFQEHIQHEDFQKGVLLSSQSLFSTIEYYKKITGENLTGKAAQIQRGLLRYFTRMVMKATPFGTFCTLIPGSFKENLRANGGSQFLGTTNGDISHKVTLVRINKSLYGVLLEHLKSRPAIREGLAVELNPTLRNIDTHLMFLSLVAGREVFQKLEMNEALDVIRSTFAERPHIVLKELVDLVCHQPTLDTIREEATQYLEKLLEVGFLRFRIGIREQEAEWDVPLRLLLDTIDDEHARAISALLKELRAICDAFVSANVKERAELLASATSLIESSFKTLGIQAKLKMNLPLYEDSTAHASLSLPLEVMRPHIELLSALSRLTYPIAWPRTEQISMRHFFNSFYKERAQSIPLLQFYEDYYREHFKSHLEKEQKLQGGTQDEELKRYNLSNPFKIDLIQQIQSAHQRITDLVRSQWVEYPLSDQIQITIEEIQSILQNIEQPADACRSLSFFAQVLPSPSNRTEPTLIVQNGQYLVGYGKYFSRFLYMFSESMQKNLVEHNESLTDDLIAEICGDGHFNANLHPPLLRWEISYPTGESGKSEEQISSADITVEPHPNDAHSLILRQVSTQKRIIPVDLGFMNIRMRPPLYQLLLHFTPASNLSFLIPETPTKQQAELDAKKNEEKSRDGTPPSTPAGMEKILYRPRVVLDNAIILSRKRWQIPASLFPRRQPEEHDGRYFLRLEHWRKEHGIPDEVFVRIRPLPQPQRPKKSESQEKKDDDQKKQPSVVQNKPVSRDFYKPQYIDFYNPLLVDLFEHLPSTLERFVVTVEERLPTKDQLFHFDDEQYATEFIFQISHRENRPLVPADTQMSANANIEHQ